MNRFDQLVHALGRTRVGVAFLWLMLCVSLLGIGGGLSKTLYIGTLVWVVVGALMTSILVRRRQLSSRAQKDEIAARADGENLDYLSGKDSGIFGKFTPD